MIRLETLFLLFCFLNFASSAPTDIITNTSVVDCLTSFFKAAYSGGYNCTESFDFFSDDRSVKEKAYTDGKSCFLEIVQEECSKSQNTLISKEYVQLSNILIKTPSNGTSCDDLYYRFNALKCTPILNEFTMSAMEMATSADLMKNKEKTIKKLSNVCDKVITCMKPVCYFPETLKKTMEESCEAIKLGNSEFSICLEKIGKHPPLTTDYPCLDGEDFVYGGTQKGVKMLTEKKRCTQQIMKDFCGEKAIVDFDKNADITAKTLKKASQLTGALFN